MEIAILLISIGLIGLLSTTFLVYKPLNMAQLSMSYISGVTEEHHQGLSFKAPWYTLQKPEINMQASIIVTSGGILVMSWEKFFSEKVYEKIAPRMYETKDSILFGSWATAIRPRKGKLNNLILKTPQVGALMTMSEIDLTISDYLAIHDTTEVLHQKKVISDIVANLFGGKDEEAHSEIGESYGIVISNPKLFDLSLGKKSQDATEKLFVTKKFRESMEYLKDEISDSDKRANAIFVATEVVNKNIVNIEGIDTAISSIANAFFRTH